MVEDVKDTQEREDKLFVMHGTELKIKKTQRIQIFTKVRQKKNNYRPIKITMENESMKTQVLQNLKKLNGITNFKVTEDLTRKERKKIKEWQEKAKTKNMQEKNENFKWLFKGSPRSGLYLKHVFVKEIVNTSGS